MITGEGRYDGQTAEGKVVGHVAALAAAAPHRPRPLVVAGSIDAPPPPGAAGRDLVGIAGSVAAAIADPEPYLVEAGRELAQALTEEVVRPGGGVVGPKGGHVRPEGEVARPEGEVVGPKVGRVRPEGGSVRPEGEPTMDDGRDDAVRAAGAAGADGGAVLDDAR